MVKKWLITGGCGFIGTNLVKNLVEEGGHFIRVLDNLSVGTRQDLSRVCNFDEKDPAFENFNSSSLISESKDSYPSIIQLIVGDILDADIARKSAEGVDTIVHLAANAGVAQSVENPKQDMEVNVFGTFNMLEAARQSDVKRFIFASSGAPIGECEPPIHEELAPHPVSPYGASKLSGEGYCSAFYETYGIETAVLRFGNVYGSGSNHKSSVIAKFIKQALIGETLQIYGDGKQTRDFIFIDDLVEAVIKAATVKDAGGEVFQIATNREYTVNEIAEILSRQLKDTAAIDMQITYSKPRIGDVRRNFSDTSKALKLLGWQSTVPLDEGIEHTVEWFLKNENSALPEHQHQIVSHQL
jgi:UDP-glucose 4-epimerase